MVEAVLSDIDGTLVESNWLHAAAWRDAFAVIDIPLDIETLRKQISKAATNSEIVHCLS
jgi:beta-phosphoglucomutase-like phosphatase (HAD superfamily)